MKNSLLKFSFYFAFLCGAFLSQAWAETGSQCNADLEDMRSQQLARLFRIETEFRDASWLYHKYQETVYNPLWQANLKKNDRFSEEVRAEGAMLFERYRKAADEDHEQSQNAIRKVTNGIERMEEGLPRDYACQGAEVKNPANPGQLSDFSNCMQVFNSEAEGSFSELKKLLLRYHRHQEDFSERVEDSLKDNRSEHAAFEDRFNDFLWPSQIKTTSQFLSCLRDLRERFELRWPGEKCCQACAADRTSHQDPVLSRVKLDPQGMQGVAGQLVNNASLVTAFEDLDEESENPENH